LKGNNVQKELKAKVEEFLETEYDERGGYSDLKQAMFRSDYPSEGYEYNGEFENAVLAKAKELGLRVDFCDNHGGEGEDYWSVYSFTDGYQVVYVKFQGWYASYNGAEFTEWFFVEPKQVQVTQYEKIAG
jgi:hypothetical protein